MRRGLFGLMSTAALIASVVAGCSSGGGTAADFELPELPGATPTVKTMEFALEDYGMSDNAVVLVSATGKDETYAKSKNVTVTAEYTGAEADAKAFAAKNALLDDEGGDGGDSGDGGSNPEDEDLEYNFRCSFIDSVRALPNQIVAGVNSKDIHPLSLGKFDGQYVGYTNTLNPPSDVGKSGSPIYVTKVVDDKYTVNCNILCQSDGEGNTAYLVGDYGVKLAKAFDSNCFDNGKGIYKAVTEAFGTEWRYSPAGGRDGDKRINIVLCDNVAMGGHFGGVRLCDAFKPSQVATANAGEFIFLNVDYLESGVLATEDPETGEIISSSPSTRTLDTLAHQLTHLIEVNTKICHEGQFDDFVLGETDPVKALERVGISEGLGELATDLCGGGVRNHNDFTVFNEMNVFMGGDDWQAQIFENTETMWSIFRDEVVYTKDGSIFCNDRGDTEHCVYGGSHMFILWLLNNFGQAKINAIMKSTDTGMENISSIVGKDIKTLFHGFNRAVYLCQFNNAPSADQFSYIRPGVPCCMYPTPQPDGSIKMEAKSLPGVKVLFDRRLRLNEDLTIEPWSAKLIGFRPGDTSSGTLNLKVRYPANGGVSVFRLTNGLLVEDVAGVELPDNQDRKR